jgi:hypothetical protein
VPGAPVGESDHTVGTVVFTGPFIPSEGAREENRWKSRDAAAIFGRINGHATFRHARRR